jgi:hypothetical protein
MKSDLIRQEFHELRNAGVTHTDIAKRLGISPRTASNWTREMALPRRKGGPRRVRWVPGVKPKIG